MRSGATTPHFQTLYLSTQGELAHTYACSAALSEMQAAVDCAQTLSVLTRVSCTECVRHIVYNGSQLVNFLPFVCSGPGWPLLDTLWGKLFFVWTPESFNDYLALYPNLEGALCFVSSVDGNSGDDGGQTVSDPAGVFIQTFDSLTWSVPLTNHELSTQKTRVSMC